MSNIISQLQLEFSELIEDVKVKNLFNGHGIFHQDIMFALHQNGSIYIKAEGDLVSYLEKLGAVAYAINHDSMKKLALYNYYQLPNSIRRNKEKFKEILILAIKQAKAKKLSDELSKKERIKELANFSIKHERLLAKVNIYTVTEYRKLGAYHSFIRLKKLGIPANIDLLWAFIAALKNKHVSLLSEEEKKKKLIKLNDLLESNGLRKMKI